MLPTLAAALWLVFLIAGAIAYLRLQIQRSPYSAWENLLYTPTYLWGRLMWRVHFANTPPPEMDGGAILVANHRSSVDPFFVQLSAGRRVHWLVAREYCESSLFGPLLKALEVIPTNRSGMDTRATRYAIRLAKAGKLVGMFPEGRLNHTSDPLISIRPGAALVAVRAGVPIIPLHIAGSPYRREVWSPLIMPGHVKITFGHAIMPPANSERDTAENSGSALPPQDESSQIDSNNSSSSRVDLAHAEQLIIQWAQQVLTMAGKPDWPIAIAGRRRVPEPSPRNSIAASGDVDVQSEPSDDQPDDLQKDNQT